MLGIRLSDEEDRRLARFARETGRPKSTIARQWILDRLDREAVDELIRNASELDARERTGGVGMASDDAADTWLRALDAEDGGYDWGPEGPPL